MEEAFSIHPFSIQALAYRQFSSLVYTCRILETVSSHPAGASSGPCPTMAIVNSIPQAQTAIKQHANGVLKVVQEVPVARVEPEWLLVRNASVALNPCDFKMAARFPTPGLLDGVDFSGTVVEAGSNSRGFKVGDRVFGCVPGNKQDDPASGSFCEYVKVEAIYAWDIPSGMSFETASALCAACIVTIGLTMHSYLRMEITPEPTADGKPRGTVLVYGGSSSVGLVAIQLLKM